MVSEKNCACTLTNVDQILQYVQPFFKKISLFEMTNQKLFDKSWGIKDFNFILKGLSDDFGQILFF